MVRVLQSIGLNQRVQQMLVIGMKKAMNMWRGISRNRNEESNNHHNV